MAKNLRVTGILLLLILGASALASGCRADRTVATDEPAVAPAAVETKPRITAVDLDRSELPRYESLEIVLAVDAEYTNPYDARQVSLEGVFTGPDRTEMIVPGFWDGQESWRVGFTPSLEGKWSYQLVLQDGRGASLPSQGDFTVTPSDLHGWLQVGRWVNPEFSGHYLVYQDGTPFYGLGHCDALNILIDGFSAEDGVVLFDKMQAANENFVVWWPLYSHSPIKNSYDQYSFSDMAVIDLVVRDAQKKGIFLIFTIWDHPQLRDQSHSWGNGRWQGYNGFRKLGDTASFFESEEAWAWQENFYRYIIARWGYSPAIGMWQTVTEINGTNAYDHTDPWHDKVNAYFVANDPYRHPTTASMSGDVDWAAGHATMDAPQVHIYALENDAVKAAQIIAGWTQLIWNRAEKPNWVGEFGVGGNNYYPELFHNAIWGALASGAAMTPAEWNSGGTWGRMTPEMLADIGRLGQFVSGIPLASLNPSALQVASSHPQVRGWGVAGKDGGLFWVQDFSMEGKSMQELRAAETVRQGVRVEIQGLAGGTYSIRPYDTWQGAYLEAFDADCAAGQACTIALPEFKADMAFELQRK